MREQEPSQTALGVAYMRAAHQLLDTPPLLFEDPLALTILGPKAEETIHAHIARHQTGFGRALRSHVCLRARFTEDMLAREKADRYVLVGAGLDTFALRQPAWAKTMRILEIDHPATQTLKRQKIAEAGLAEPENLSFVAADFTRETLGDILGRQQIDAGEKVFFAWLGVTMYLTQEEIDTSLSAMAKACDHPALCLTFKQPDKGQSDKAMRELVASLGEHFVSAFTPGEMAEKLAAHGFTRQEFLSPERAVADYFTPPRQDLAPVHRSGIVYAAI